MIRINSLCISCVTIFACLCTWVDGSVPTRATLPPPQKKNTPSCRRPYQLIQFSVPEGLIQISLASSQKVTRKMYLHSHETNRLVKLFDSNLFAVLGNRKQRVCRFIFIFIIYLLQLGCYPVAVVILHVNKT